MPDGYKQWLYIDFLFIEHRKILLHTFVEKIFGPYTDREQFQLFVDFLSIGCPVGKILFEFVGGGVRSVRADVGKFVGIGKANVERLSSTYRKSCTVQRLPAPNAPANSSA